MPWQDMIGEGKARCRRSSLPRRRISPKALETPPPRHGRVPSLSAADLPFVQSLGTAI
jgi:hypothetical protein